MSMEREFCVEKIDAYGALKKLELQYPRNFNFGYDVVDVIAARTPQKKRLSGAMRKGKNTSLPSRISEDSATGWRMYSKKRGFKGATASWWC